MGKPPPAPQGDAVPSGAPVSQASAPAVARSAASSSNPAGKKKIVKIAGIAVVLIAGLGAGIYFGWPYIKGFIGGDPFATPDGTIKYVANGLAENKPQVLWEAMPASYKQTLNDELKKSMSNADPEIHSKSVAILQKLSGVLKSKKDMIIQAANGAAQQGGGDGGLPPELTDNWDDILGILDILTSGKIADIAWVQNPDVGSFLTDEGAKIMALPVLERLLDKGMQEDQQSNGPKSLAEIRTGLKSLEVVVISQTESEATLKIVSQNIIDGGESGELKMVRMEERWLPKDMVDDWDAVIKEIKETTPLGSLTEKKMTDEEKKSVMALLDMVDQALDKAGQANNGDELMVSVMEAAGGVTGTLAAQGEGGLGGLFGPTGGGQGGGGGKPSVGKTTEWTFGGEKRNLQAWKGQSAKNVLGVFGDPDKGTPWGQNGGAWTYEKMKIIDVEGKPYKSVTFFIQNGQVMDIKLPSAVSQPTGSIE